MNIKKVTAVYFSPTHGTKTYITEIAKRLDAEFCSIDLTKPDNREKEYSFGETDLVLFGAPVYAGRLPEIPGGIFDRVKGSYTPAVFTVSYGNREFEDALLEEKDICEANGFVGIAAAAWIAPHTFSENIAAGRPDEEDMGRVREFAEAVSKLLEKDMPESGKLSVPGNRPYRDGKKMPFHPKGNRKCTDCKTCVSACPVRAIPRDNPKETDTDLCIDCLACVRSCPFGARGVFSPVYKVAVTGLEAKLVKPRKEPAVFLAE